MIGPDCTWLDRPRSTHLVYYVGEENGPWVWTPGAAACQQPRPPTSEFLAQKHQRRLSPCLRRSLPPAFWSLRLVPLPRPSLGPGVRFGVRPESEWAISALE